MAQADSKNSITAPVDTTRRFEILKDAEDALMEQGFKLVPDTCNWFDPTTQIDAGVYPVEEANGVSKYRIEYRSRHNRVLSTPTNTSPLCPKAAIAPPETGRFDADPPQRAPVVGARPTRRMIMNSLVALPIVAALPVAAPAMPSTAADQASLDAELVQAAHGLQATDQALSDLHDKFGDDADGRADYHALQRQRNDHIATLIVVPALSAAGVQAKAAVLRLDRLIEDYEQHQQVAVSLADDIAERSLPLRPVSARQPDPVYAAIDTYEKAYVECRAACAESRRLYDHAIKVAGKSEVTIPDLRGPGAPTDMIWKLPVAYEQDGLKYVVAPSIGFINEYLPGEANEQIRQSFAKRLDEIQEAQEAAYGGIDADKIVEGPAEAELHAVDDLVQTVPTTLAGLMAFLSCLAKFQKRDPDMLDDYHMDPLVKTLGKAAAVLS